MRRFAAIAFMMSLVAMFAIGSVFVGCLPGGREGDEQVAGANRDKSEVATQAAPNAATHATADDRPQTPAPIPQHAPGFESLTFDEIQNLLVQIRDQLEINRKVKTEAIDLRELAMRSKEVEAFRKIGDQFSKRIDDREIRSLIGELFGIVELHWHMTSETPVKFQEYDDWARTALGDAQRLVNEKMDEGN